MMVEINKIYSRREDMSPNKRLNIYIEPNGDVALYLTKDNLLIEDASVEFCTHTGGGQSPHTRLALIELIEAIEKDNNENPF